MVRKIFIIFGTIIFMLQIINAEAISGTDSKSHFYEQVTQHQCRDCGLRSLVTACKLLGIETTLENVSNPFEPNDDITMYDLYKIANREGLNIQWVGLSIDEFKEINSPTIVCTTDKHFMIVDKIAGDNVQIIDHEVRYSVNIEEFRKMWDKCVLILSKPDKTMQ